MVIQQLASAALPREDEFKKDTLIGCHGAPCLVAPPESLDGLYLVAVRNSSNSFRSSGTLFFASANCRLSSSASRSRRRIAAASSSSLWFVAEARRGARSWDLKVAICLSLASAVRSYWYLS